MQVHPVAALFPMMNEAELDDLAADIKANGLRMPIVTSDDGETLIDGRNRLAACERAKVKPKFVRLNGEDPVKYILSANVARRQMTKAQIAITLGRVRLLDSNNTQQEAVSEFGISRAAIAQAETVIHFAPGLADQVVDKGLSFDSAYEQARAIRAAAKDNQKKLERLREHAPDLADLTGISLDDAIAKLDRREVDARKLNEIRKEAPDLVALVEEGRLTVSDAVATNEDRKAKRYAAREGATTLLAKVIQLLGVRNPEDDARRLMENVDRALWPSERIDQLSSEHLMACGVMLQECARLLEKRHG